MAVSSSSSSTSLSTSLTNSNLQSMNGGFKATDLWKQIITDFRNGIPLKKKRYRIKYYTQCFSGCEAVEWLLKHLSESGRFVNIGKDQVSRLLQKFIEFAVIEEVRSKENRKFDDSFLYSFVTVPNVFNGLEEEPAAKPSPPKNTCITNTYAMIHFSRSSDCSEMVSLEGREDPPKTESYGSKEREIGSVWKEFILARLLRLVDLPSLDGVLSHDEVDGKLILRNIGPLHWLLRLAKHGGRCHDPTEAEGGLPAWLCMAQKYLIEWPNGAFQFECGLPEYRGFEVDVLKVIYDFYSSQDVLISSKLLDLHLAVLRMIRDGKKDARDALQMCTLLLPRDHRLRLHRLLRFMNKVSRNEQLCFSELMSNEHLLLERFSRFVLFCDQKRTTKKDIRELVHFMMEEYSYIFLIPDDLKLQVEEFLDQRQSTDLAAATLVSSCQKVSNDEYELQKKDTHKALAQLLDSIEDNGKLSQKEKKLKLKMFRKQYPEIYAAKFGISSLKS